MSILRRLAAAALVAGVGLLATAGPAAAHAELVSSDPANGAVLATAPETVTLTFNEPVRLTSQEIVVYDAEGETVPSDATASGAEVTVDLPDASELGRGTFVVSWYVVSADGHPISGSVTFSVGERSDQVATPPPATTSSRAVTVLLGVLTGATYLGLLVAAGLAAFVALVLPARYVGQRVRARIRGLTRVAAGVAGVAAVLQVPVSSAYAQGLELPDVLAGFDAALVENEIGSAVLLLIGLGCVVAALGDQPPETERRVALLVGAGLAVSAPSIVGHTRAYEPSVLLVVTDITHVAAGAVWLGGLVGLVLALRALAGREELAATTLARFSVVAGGLLLVMASTGALLAWRILGSWASLVETTYGRLLLVKIGLVLVVAAIGAWNRFGMLPKVRSAAGFADRTHVASLVTRTVAVEALVIVGLLGVTGFLVNQSPRPAPDHVPSGWTAVESAEVGDLTVLAMMTPRVPGPNVVSVQIQDADSQPVDLAEPPVVSLESGSIDLGVMLLTQTDVGTYRADALLPQAGTWEVQVSVRISRFESAVTTLDFEVADVREP